MSFNSKMFSEYIGAIDQGTTSTRFLIFDRTGSIVSLHQHEFKQIYPHPGWIEHDPMEILESVEICIRKTIEDFVKKNKSVRQIKGLGITNQRETIVVWDKDTGKPLYNAIVWSDTRTIEVVRELKQKEDASEVHKICGLPISTYFSAVKLRWLLDNVRSVREVYDSGRLAFGTIDSWLIYNLTGNIDGGIHITDATNASRTMLLNIRTLEYDESLINFFGLEKLHLPKIKSSSEIYGEISSGPLCGTPLSGCLGDQSAALVGHLAFTPGSAKNTYGTGCFLLYNTGETPVISKEGLLTTVGYFFKGQKPVYALEGSIAVAGAAIKWFRDQMGVITEASQIDEMAASVEDTAGIVFVTAFSGLFAPYWRDDARGTILGITNYTTKEHIARSILEAICFQTKAILDVMNRDSGSPLKCLNVDGGITNSDICMQIQSDIVGIDVNRPQMREVTALGSAIAAGLAVGVWKNVEELQSVSAGKTFVFSPKISEDKRNRMFCLWEKAVQKSLDWETGKSE
ncbi:glycerol kinase [Pneumocystis murina B123]|uniref:Probable glycerol kinase n=1 Tax=Pneumocystis murina (strain B123) TaxID=1069680 RepID=M7PCJ3_PNEMU|nr:glycerol kinase [Pneumocystis murina B123]EMR08184.1 glycerol kinase [Pneumocystis murina B123]